LSDMRLITFGFDSFESEVGGGLVVSSKVWIRGLCLVSQKAQDRKFGF